MHYACKDLDLSVHKLCRASLSCRLTACFNGRDQSSLALITGKNVWVCLFGSNWSSSLKWYTEPWWMKTIISQPDFGRDAAELNNKMTVVNLTKTLTCTPGEIGSWFSLSPTSMTQYVQVAANAKSKLPLPMWHRATAWLSPFVVRSFLDTVHTNLFHCLGCSPWTLHCQWPQQAYTLQKQQQTDLTLDNYHKQSHSVPLEKLKKQI